MTFTLYDFPIRQTYVYCPPSAACVSDQCLTRHLFSLPLDLFTLSNTHPTNAGIDCAQADPVNDQRLARHLASLYWAQPPDSVQSIIPLETLKEFIAFSQNRVNPKLTDEACMLLAQGYLEMRMAGQDATGNINRYANQLTGAMRMASN